MSQGSKTKICHHCPFCGGPVLLEHEEIIASCGNCGSMLRLLPPSGTETFMVDSAMEKREAVFLLEREFKRDGLPLIKQRGEIFRVYLPFYRAAGKVFDFQKRVEERKNVTEDGQEYSYQVESHDARIRQKEMSFAAFENDRFGIESMGVRTHVLELSPLTPRLTQDKLFLNPSRDVNYALDRYEKTTASMSAYAGEGARRRFSKALCPHISMVYMPVWVVNYTNELGSMYAVIDCISGRVEKQAGGEMSLENLHYSEAVEGTVFKLVAHRCDYCGFDLPRQKNGEMFVCGNCGRLYKIRGESYESHSINLPGGDYANDSLFPFWMFRLSASDQNRIFCKNLNLDSKTVFIPAFEITNLKRAARLSLSLSRAIDEINFDKCEESAYTFQTAVLTAHDASGLVLPFLLAGRDDLEHFDLESLWRLYLEFEETSLVWLPFAEEGYFYRGLLTGQGFEKAALVT
jgi:predicted RNA-binding Zn-ribbon protein involved in translation (DUF1610 family)